MASIHVGGLTFQTRSNEDNSIRSTNLQFSWQSGRCPKFVLCLHCPTGRISHIHSVSRSVESILKCCKGPGKHSWGHLLPGLQQIGLPRETQRKGCARSGPPPIDDCLTTSLISWRCFVAPLSGKTCSPLAHSASSGSDSIHRAAWVSGRTSKSPYDMSPKERRRVRIDQQHEKVASS